MYSPTVCLHSLLVTFVALLLFVAKRLRVVSPARLRIL